MAAERERLVVGISGASGAVLGIELLRTLQEIGQFETHLVISGGGERTIADETPYSLEEVTALADVYHDFRDIGASIASGSFRTAGMVIMPCSMKTLAGIASGYSDNLELRAADVTLKEGRKLVLCVRETPLSRIHLRNMLTLSEMGAVILPPMMTYYSGPQTVQDMTRHVVGKVLDQFGVDAPGFRRWKGGRIV